MCTFLAFDILPKFGVQDAHFFRSQISDFKKRKILIAHLDFLMHTLIKTVADYVCRILFS